MTTKRDLLIDLIAGQWSALPVDEFITWVTDRIEQGDIDTFVKAAVAFQQADLQQAIADLPQKIADEQAALQKQHDDLTDIAVTLPADILVDPAVEVKP